MSQLAPKIVELILQESPLSKASVLNTLQLLYVEECTVPFIARYRKEVTGNLDEVNIRSLQERYLELQELEQRRAFILETLKTMEKLTPELTQQIQQAKTLNLLEDIYAPFKSKKKSKGQLAQDVGLLPLATLLKENKLTLAQMEQQLGSSFRQAYQTLSEGKITTFEQAVLGAQDIIIEEIAHHLEAKEHLRRLFWEQGSMQTHQKKDASSIEDYQKFKDFFEFSCPLKSLREKKAGHRFLAMRRGMNLKILSVETHLDEALALKTLQLYAIPTATALGPQQTLLQNCAMKAWKIYLAPSLDLEIKTELKKIADEGAIEVFGINLKNLLLQPYLGPKAVLGIDPGQRTGCKIVVVDATGKLLGDHVIYPHPPQEQLQQSAIILSKIIQAFNIEYIAIGNGTAGLETLSFVQTHVPEVKNEQVKAVMVNEAGASIYSASDIAREEFPDKDVTVRGAISIARRLQDPLAELVKIDAKSIGVGQYQHDVNQSKLNSSLDQVVESCVNFVGVDLNTASAPLLSYVSGVGPAVAKNIVEFRQKNGGFKKRHDLLAVSRMNEKVFTQAAGFLRIYNGENPLDATFIHPERYHVLEQWCQEQQHTIKDLCDSAELKEKCTKDHKLREKLGEHTFVDMIKSLKAPGQDPRKVFKNVEFTKGLKSLNDLIVGEWYQGIITNITLFGAFVDIGLKQNGLLHVSELSNEFVTNPMDKVQVGQEVRVRVVSVDHERQRIALSCKTAPSFQKEHISANMPSGKKTASAQQPGAQFKNNPFANLGKIKI